MVQSKNMVEQIFSRSFYVLLQTHINAQNKKANPRFY